jgi:lysophospholipase L1-like esterase
MAGFARGETKVLADFEGGASTVKVDEGAPGLLTATIAADAGGGHCMELAFKRGEKAGYAYAHLPVGGELAKSAGDYDGITFKVKGDGTSTFGLIEIRANDYVNIYQAVFPLTSTEWKEVSVRWDDFFQMNDNSKAAKIDWPNVNNFGFGSRAGWGSCSYAVDDLTLAKIPARPAEKAPDGAARLEKTVAKLKAGGPVKIAALGDSITFGTKVPSEKRGSGLYFQIAAAGLEKQFQGAKVTTINAGVGGNTIAEGIVRIGHQVAPEKPDLVMVLLGANDAIYRFADERVQSTMSILIDKLLETTGAEILLLGPGPCGEAPGVAEHYAEILAGLAARKGVAYLSMSTAMGALTPADRAAVFNEDNVHWSETGHRLMGKAVLDYVAGLAQSK